MTAAFRAELPTTQKFVLVALCDSANDQGECYPGIPLLMAKCSLSDRGVQRALGDLESRGFLRREFRTGRSTTYWLTLEKAINPRPTVTPDQPSPPTDVHPTPERPSPPPPTHSHPTPDPQSPITIIEPSIEPSEKQKKERRAVDPPAVSTEVLVLAGFDVDTAAEFIACKAKRKAPLTKRAWVDHCSEAEKAGWTPLAAAEKVMAKTWKGFEAKYVSDETPQPRVARAPPVAFQTAKQRDAADAAARHRQWTGQGPADAENVIDMETTNARIASR